MRFKNLKAEFTRIGMSIEQIANELDFDPSTFYNRLSSKTKWTLNDMLKVQKFVNEKNNSHYTLDYLFAKED